MLSDYKAVFDQFTRTLTHLKSKGSHSSQLRFEFAKYLNRAHKHDECMSQLDELLIDDPRCYSAVRLSALCLAKHFDSLDGANTVFQDFLSSHSTSRTAQADYIFFIATQLRDHGEAHRQLAECKRTYHNYPPAAQILIAAAAKCYLNLPSMSIYDPDSVKINSRSRTPAWALTILAVLKKYPDPVQCRAKLEQTFAQYEYTDDEKHDTHLAYVAWLLTP